MIIMELSFLELDLAYLDPSTSCRRLYTPHSEQTDHRNFEQVDKTTKNPQSCVCRGASKIWGAHGYCDLPREEIKTHCVRRQSIIGAASRDKAQSPWTARPLPDFPGTSYWVKPIHEGRAWRSQAAVPRSAPAARWHRGPL